MKINWFTVIAQIINFLILVWLLKRYLYKPILSAVDEREKKISSQLNDAKSDKEEAKKQQDEFEKKNEDFDKQKKTLMDKTIADTKDEKTKLLEEARAEANKLSAKLQEASKENLEKLNSEIIHKTQQEVFAIARKTLSDIASVSLEEQSVSNFIKKIEGLKEEEIKKITDAFAANSTPVIIQSAFELPDKQQADIKNAIKKLLGDKTELNFKVNADIISGIELNANGYKLAWSISEYLNSLEKSISESIQQKTQPELKEDTDKQKNEIDKHSESDK